MTANQQTPAAQAKACRQVAMLLVVAGLMIGVVMPVIFYVMHFEILMTASGFDWFWAVLAAFMLIDFGMAVYFSRRAAAIERTIPPA